jgi:hypothetical protein
MSFGWDDKEMIPHDVSHPACKGLSHVNTFQLKVHFCTFARKLMCAAPFLVLVANWMRHS